MKEQLPPHIVCILESLGVEITPAIVKTFLETQ